jgi:putative tryptophan/tyrosine transport system substrate-binding protein
MRRREFITVVGGAAAMWPMVARAQEIQQIRRVGWLSSGLAENDPESQARVTAFVRALKEFGWIEGQNVQIIYRWGGGSADATRKYATELATLSPDVNLAIASQAVQALQQASSTVPIVFTLVPDPIGAGFVDNLARPGGNITGFTTSSMGLERNGLSCSRRSRPASSEWLYSAIP